MTAEQDPSVQVRYVVMYDKVGNDHKTYVELRILKGEEDFSDLAGFLKEKEPESPSLEWTDYDGYTACRFKTIIGSWDQLVDVFEDMRRRFNPLIRQYLSEEEQNSTLPPEKVKLNDRGNDVDLYTWTLLQVLNLDLQVPDYQRIYCWDEKTIRVLWEDIMELKDNQKYRLGTLIFQRKGETFEIIDGQQRLVTLSLILSALHIQGFCLLEQKYQSQLAEQYIGYNKYLIKNLLSRVRRSERRTLAERLWRGIEFDVLVLKDTSLDLAYTFFSNENSRGKELSDFDLLKAHHLRFLTDNPRQAEHLARKWDKMILEGDKAGSDNDRAYVRSLSMYVFRLRHWIRMQDWDEKGKYRVKKEFESAAYIQEIPPFGEQFDWNESIQGGSHFFAYVEIFLDRFRAFASSEAYRSIHGLDGETHCWYRDVIESLLFCYYLKFGELYLAEALILIAAKVSGHRYANDRAHLGRLLRYAADTRVVMMVDRASSPTFFLAELLQNLKETIPSKPKSKIQCRYDHTLSKCLDGCKKSVEIPEIIQIFER